MADLAAAVGSAEHKVSRAITQALRERNFNQWVNRYRIAHACRLLEAGEGRSVLEVSLDRKKECRHPKVAALPPASSRGLLVAIAAAAGLCRRIGGGIG